MDLNQVGLNWREANVTGWQSGDFNGDGLVNAMDLNIVGINWLNGVAAVAVAAEVGAQRRIPRAPLAAVEATIPPTVTDAAFANQYGPQLASSRSTIERMAPDDGKIDRYLHPDDITETIGKLVSGLFRLSSAPADLGTDHQGDVDSVAELESVIVDQILASLFSQR